MASFKEFFDFSRNTNANTMKAGLYAIEPEIPKEPLVKVGYSRNLMARMSSYRNIYPQGIKIHMIGRVPTRDQAFSTNRDDVVAAEKLMLNVLKDPWMKRKEWFSADKLNEIKKALGDAQKKFATTYPMKRRLYTADEIKVGARGVKREMPEYEEKPESTLVKMEMPPKKRRTGLSTEEQIRGAKRMKEDDKQVKLDEYAESKHRSGGYYKGTEEPPKRRRITKKRPVGELVTDVVEPVSRLKKKTKSSVGV